MSAEERTRLAKQACEAIATKVVQNVCELPDYISPDDQPDLLTCTVAELHLCVMRALGQDV
jgi:hypothetical protein